MSISKSDVEDKGKSPRKVSTDEGTVTERSVDDLIKADQYANSKDVGDNPLHGLRISRCKPAGPV